MIDITTKVGATKAKKHIRHQFDKSGISYERFLDCLRQTMVNQVRLYDILNNENVFPTQSEYQDIIKALASIDTTQKVELTTKQR